MKNQSGFIHWPLKPIKCSTCGLKKLCFAKNLNEQETSALEAIIAENQNYKRRDYLYHVGNCITDLVVIKSGSAKTVLLSEDGSEQIVNFHFAGDLLGLDSLADKHSLSAVVFLEDSNICRIPYPAFNALSEQTPQLHAEIITRLSNQIASGHELMLSINHHSAEQRFVFFLQDLASRQFNRGLYKDHLYLSMSRDEIANYLGLAPATVSRIIGKLERDRMIQADNKHLQLLDYQRLINIIHPCADCAAMSI